MFDDGGTIAFSCFAHVLSFCTLVAGIGNELENVAMLKLNLYIHHE
jgi:hypothetical protein